ncbi:MAG TPA: hypothetical protein VKB23_05090 [Solirubrobacterales bacterium]|nr:hypothetical protein [Solirubrobacterales bacterium]
MNRPFRQNRVTRRLVSFALAALAAIGAFGAAASAASAAPVLSITGSSPDQVTPGKWLAMIVAIHNEGDEAMSGTLTLRYTFDEGLASSFADSEALPENTVCTSSAQEVECTADASVMAPHHLMTFKLLTFVEAGAESTLNAEVQVTGGGASNPATYPLSFDTGPVGPFQFKAFEMAIADNPKLPTAQAGSHPREVSARASFYGHAATPLDLEPAFTFIATPESFRNLSTHLPVGFVGDPTATGSRCTAGQLSFSNHDPDAKNNQVPSCPDDSQVGYALLNGKDLTPMYNLVPSAGVPAEFGLYYQGVPVIIPAKLRPSDYGVDLYTVRAATADQLTSIQTVFWGTPADSFHDDLRPQCIRGLSGASGERCLLSSASKSPLLRLPTSCSGEPLRWEMEMDTYLHPDILHRRSATTPATTGCDSVPFEPHVSLAPTDGSAHSASGLAVDLTLPQGSGPDGIATADVKSVSLEMPRGISLNPAAADGLATCTDAQLRIGREGPAECPEASRLGSVEVDTPLLAEAIGGSVYLRTQNSQDPESGQMYRLAIVLHSAERGVDVKLPGSLVVNKTTGQLTTTFEDLPQLPFESMHMQLKTGPRAPLTTPQACGTYAAQATLTGWNGKTVKLAPGISVDQGCNAPGFAPGFRAGVTDSKAGAFSPLLLRVTRDSGQPNISRIDATLPEGELAKLAGVGVCSDAEAAALACPAASRIGSVQTGIGEGSLPLFLPQPGKAPSAVYLAGPYKSAPYSVIASVPAQAGPFDLGTVAVRSALQINPTTTQATVLSDPLPQIYGGIPVSYRDLRVLVDRPGFTLNPTSCEPQAVRAAIEASNGDVANVSDRFQASDCGALAFKPKLTLALEGGTTRSKHPALRATLTMPLGGANVERASVALPHSEFLAQGHIRTICTRVQFAAGGGNGGGCPKRSIYGRARATSPLLDYPLAGPVYLRSSDNSLPDLVAALHGQIDVNLVGRIDSMDGGIRTTFEDVPDAPVTKFVLSMQGGKKGLLENSADLCAATHRAIAEFDGQNGRIGDSRPALKADCGKGRKGKRATER